MALTVGSRIGHYDVTALLGEGGMGEPCMSSSRRRRRTVMERSFAMGAWGIPGVHKAAYGEENGVAGRIIRLDALLPATRSSVYGEAV